MKKIYLILLILPALACFAGNKTQTIITSKITTVPATIIFPPVNYIPLPTSTQMPACIVSVKSLNVRSSPESDVIGWLYSGDLITILEDTPHDRGAWIRIQAGVITGWINSKYCKRKN
jgi:hypothetical protein